MAAIDRSTVFWYILVGISEENASDMGVREYVVVIPADVGIVVSSSSIGPSLVLWVNIRSKEISTSRFALIRIMNCRNTKLIQGTKEVVCTDQLGGGGQMPNLPDWGQ
jgi:hypothetical protein